MSRELWAEELAEVLEVAIARGEQLGYADDDYRERLSQIKEGVVSRGRIMQFCVTHMAPRVWTGEDNCVYRASWKASYPDPCTFEWMRFSFDVEPEEAEEWLNRKSGGL